MHALSSFWTLSARIGWRILILVAVGVFFSSIGYVLNHVPSDLSEIFLASGITVAVYLCTIAYACSRYFSGEELLSIEMEIDRILASGNVFFLIFVMLSSTLFFGVIMPALIFLCGVMALFDGLTIIVTAVLTSEWSLINAKTCALIIAGWLVIPTSWYAIQFSLRESPITVLFRAFQRFKKR